MKDLVLAMIAASKGAQAANDYYLNMSTWICGSSCCLCGDVIIARDAYSLGGYKYIRDNAIIFSNQLDEAAVQLFGAGEVALSIYAENARRRLCSAKDSKLLTPKQLNHPHLQEEHSNRTIAIDYMENVILPLIEIQRTGSSKVKLHLWINALKIFKRN